MLTTHNRYEIDRQSVPEAEFLAFKKQLKIDAQPQLTAQEAPPPWETPGQSSGSEMVYRAVDRRGKKYTYREMTQRYGEVLTQNFQLTEEK